MGYYKYSIEGSKEVGKGIMPFEMFSKYIEKIKLVEEVEANISKELRKLPGSCVGFSLSEGYYEVVTLLSYIFNDKCEYLSYWVYELEFGAKDGKISMNGVRIPHRSVEEIYSLLVNEYFISKEV